MPAEPLTDGSNGFQEALRLASAPNVSGRVIDPEDGHRREANTQPLSMGAAAPDQHSVVCEVPDRLAKRPQMQRCRKNGAQGRSRTTDTAIFSRMLYQLSYLGTSFVGGRAYRTG